MYGSLCDPLAKALVFAILPMFLSIGHWYKSENILQKLVFAYCRYYIYCCGRIAEAMMRREIMWSAVHCQITDIAQSGPISNNSCPHDHCRNFHVQLIETAQSLTKCNHSERLKMIAEHLVLVYNKRRRHGRLHRIMFMVAFENRPTNLQSALGFEGGSVQDMQKFSIRGRPILNKHQEHSDCCKRSVCLRRATIDGQSAMLMVA